jgi:hypothetical protein
LRPSVSEMFDGNVQVTYSDPSFNSGRNSEPRRGNTTSAAARPAPASASTHSGRISARRSSGTYRARAARSTGDSRWGRGWR